MSDDSEDQENSSSETFSELDSDDRSTCSSDAEEESPLTLKERLCCPKKSTEISNLPQIMKEIQSIIDKNSEDKKNGRKCSIWIFYCQQKEKKEQNQEKEKEEVPEESRLSNNTAAQPEPRQDQRSSSRRPPKRARKKFFR